MRYSLPALLLALLAPAVSLAAGPVCALLDPEKTPQATLLEAKLLAEPGTTWVERAEIDKVLKEQKLQAAFGPQGVADRVQLGKILKADLLVLVRSVKGAESPALEVVVCETATGLRLLLRGVPVTKDADADAAALLAAVREGIKRQGEKVTDVVAVPPFVSNDLGYQFEHLKGAYAKLAESVALDRKGVVVVELAEAEALAKELRLAAPGSPLRERPPPVFLLGEYRNEGKAGNRTVFVKLRAERNGKPVGKPAAETLKPVAVPDAIRAWAAGVLDAAGAAAPPKPDPKAEAGRLGELARVHRRLGNWPEALALIDASLMLDPKQPELNADAIEILPRWISDILRPAPLDVERVRRAAEAHRRGLEHLETLVTDGAKLARYAPQPGAGPRNPPRQFASDATRPFGGPLPPAVMELVRPLRDEEAALYAKLVVLVAKQGDLDEEVYYARRASAYPTTAEGYAALEKVLLGLLDLPGTKERMRAHLLYPSNLPRGAMFPEHRAFLDRLEATGNADVKAAVAEARKVAADLERAGKEQAEGKAKEMAARATFDAARKVDPTLGKPLSVTEPERLEAALAGGPLRLVRLVAEPAEPDPRIGPAPEQVFPRVAQIRGVIPAGPGVDVLWADGEFGDGTLYVMKQKGTLRRCYRLGGLRSRYTAVEFDGRYVWAAGERPGAPPVLLVLDPATERVVVIAEKDGLPVARKAVAPRPDERPPGYRVAILDPGRVCVTGSFGQAWVGVATFDEKKGAAVKIIHEARDAVNDLDPADWKKTTVSFAPRHAFTLRGEAAPGGKPPVRVLITRMGGKDLLRHPLLVDPDGPSVEVMQDAVPGLGVYAVCGTGESVYVARGTVRIDPVTPNNPRVWRIEYPGKFRDLGPGPATSALQAIHFDGRSLHLVRGAAQLDPWQEFIPPKERWWPAPDPGGWWVADRDGKDLRKAADGFKPVIAVGTSSHYGLVAIIDLHNSTALCTVTPDPAPKK